MGRGTDLGLGGIALFAGMAPDRRAAVERQCTFRHFAAGEQIIDRNSDSRDMLCVVRGAVRIVIYAASGREVSFEDIDAGGCFGELACIDGQARSASAVALHDSTVAAIRPAVLEGILLEDTGVALALMRRMARVIRNSTDRIVSLSVLGAYNRVCAELYHLARASSTAGGPADVAYIHPMPSNGDIAARISTTRQTVSRVMSDLAGKRVLAKERGRLAILDMAKLKLMVEQVHGGLIDPEDHTWLLC